CVPENYSPVALLCRLGVEPSTTITIAVAAAVLLIGWLLLRRLPDLPEARWEVFAVACLLSGLLGPIDWASYGVLMAPLFLLLPFRPADRTVASARANTRGIRCPALRMPSRRWISIGRLRRPAKPYSTPAVIRDIDSHRRTCAIVR